MRSAARFESGQGGLTQGGKLKEEFLAVDLTTLSGGAAIERFQRELDVVLQNVLDPNTDWKTAREILLKVKICPQESRRAGTIKVSCASKLAGYKAHQAPYFVRAHEGRSVIVQEDPDQMELQLGPKVVPMNGGKEDDLVE